MKSKLDASVARCVCDVGQRDFSGRNLNALALVGDVLGIKGAGKRNGAQRSRLGREGKKPVS